MADVWYCSDTKKTLGPFTLGQLKTTLSSIPNAQDILVWRDGFKDWQCADSVQELFAEAIVPPPLPNSPPIGVDTKPASSSPASGGGAFGRYTGGVTFLVILGIWAYFGFPSPTTLLEWPSAKQDCIDFATKHRSDLFLGPSSKPIRAVDSWLKNGKVVVELGVFDDSESTFLPRICVVGGGSIQIVSLLESGAWQ